MWNTKNLKRKRRWNKRKLSEKIKVKQKFSEKKRKESEKKRKKVKKKRKKQKNRLEFRFALFRLEAKIFFKALVARCHSFYLFLHYSSRHTIFIYTTRRVPLLFLHCFRSVEGLLWGAEPRFETRACRTASRHATIWATPHPEAKITKLKRSEKFTAKKTKKSEKKVKKWKKAKK